MGQEIKSLHTGNKDKNICQLVDGAITVETEGKKIDKEKDKEKENERENE